jgi:hypothetical protein
VQADQAVFRVVEGVRHRADDPEPECLPQVHGRGIGLDDRVELDAREALLAAPVNDVLAAAARGEKTLVRAIGDYERQMTGYGFAAVRAAGAEPAAGVSSGPPGGWFPWWRGRAAARRASGGPRRAARPGIAR